jgi:hypothetical protein
MIRMRLILADNSVAKFGKTTKSVFKIDVEANRNEINAT